MANVYDEKGRPIKIKIVPARGYPYDRKVLYVSPTVHQRMKAEAIKQSMTLEALTDKVLMCFLDYGMKDECAVSPNNVLNSSNEFDG